MYLSNKLSTGGEGETERLRVILKDVLHTVVELHVDVLHVTEGDPLAQQHLVEWTDKESCKRIHDNITTNVYDIVHVHVYACTHVLCKKICLG